MHVGDPRRRPRDRGAQRAAPLPARAARALGELALRRGRRHAASIRRARRSSRGRSRAAGSRTRTTAGAASRTTSRSSTAPARSPSTRSSGGASARTSPTRRSRSGSWTASPTSPRRRASRRSRYALAARCARALDEGEPLPRSPRRLLEENMWRAIRYGLAGELIDFERGEPVPARARLEQLLEWVAPGRRRDRRRAVTWRSRRRTPPSGSARGSRRAPTLQEIYAEQVRPQVSGLADERERRARPATMRRASIEADLRADQGRRSSCSRPSRRSPRSPTASSSERELDEAKAAIDAIGALLPVLEGQVDDEPPARLRAGADEPPGRLRRRRSRSSGRVRIAPAPKPSALDFVRGGSADGLVHASPRAPGARLRRRWRWGTGSG